MDTIPISNELGIVSTDLATPPVRLVYTADKLHNIRCILADYRQMGEALWVRFNGGKEGTLWYYRTLADLFKIFNNSPLTRELDSTVTGLETLVSHSSRKQSLKISGHFLNRKYAASGSGKPGNARRRFEGGSA